MNQNQSTEKKKKVGFRKILNHPLLSFAFFSSKNLIFSALGSCIFLIPVYIFNDGASREFKDYFVKLGSIAGSLLVLVIFSLKYKRNFSGFFAKPDFRDKETYLLFFLIFSIDIASCVFSFDSLNFKFKIHVLLTSLHAGIVEEITFRAFGTGVMMKAIRNEKKLWMPVLIPSIFFGICHMSNMALGQNLSGTLLQVAFTFCHGTLYSAFYLRTGSIFLPVINHFLHDFILLLHDNEIINNGNSMSAKDWIINIVCCVLYLSLSIFLMRKSKRQAVLSLWKGIWIDGMSNKEDSVIETDEEMDSKKN